MCGAQQVKEQMPRVGKHWGDRESWRQGTRGVDG